jgi:hypothetical protein
VAVGAVRHDLEARAYEQVAQPVDLLAHAARRHPGGFCDFGSGDDSPVTLVQRGTEPPFRRRSLAPAPVDEHERKVRTIDSRIEIHQIRGGDLSATATAKICHDIRTQCFIISVVC